MISLSERTKKKYIYLLLLIGGIGLLIYSIYINDLIFIILQTAYILIVIYDIIKLTQNGSPKGMTLSSLPLKKNSKK